MDVDIGSIVGVEEGIRVGNVNVGDAVGMLGSILVAEGDWKFPQPQSVSGIMIVSSDLEAVWLCCIACNNIFCANLKLNLCKV